MLTEPMFKGAVIREFVAWYQEVHGDEQLRKLAARAPEDHRALFDPDESLLTFLPASWYPVRALHVVMDALSDTHSEAELRRMFRDASRWVVKRSVNSVYRFLLANVVTPELYAQAVGRLWRQLHTTGDRRITMRGPNELESVVSNWPGHHVHMCTLTIETMCALFETMGCRDIAWERVRCVAQGAEDCVTIVKWR